MPPSPANLAEDLAEIIHKERLQDSTTESVYETDSNISNNKEVKAESSNSSKTGNENKSVEEKKDQEQSKTDQQSNNQSNRKVRKSLESSWDVSSNMPYIAETPVSDNIS